MTWLKRCCWLAAWGLWLWLGFGLYRELPRDLGPVACRLPVAKSDTLVGFAGASDNVVILSMQDKYRPAWINTFDGRTGKLVDRSEGPPFTDDWCFSQAASRHGVLFANRSTAPPLSLFARLELFDFEQKAWRALAKGRGVHFAVHPTRPWVAFSEFAQWSSTVHRIAAIDFSTGKEVFSRPLTKGVWAPYDPVFLANDRLVIFLTTDPPARIRGQRGNNPDTDAPGDWHVKHSVEVWRLTDPPALEKTIDGVSLGFIESVGLNGRVSFSQAPVIPAYGVFDLNEGRNVFVHPHRDDDFDESFHNRTSRWARLSPSGRAVLGGNPPTLRDVDSNRLLWRPPAPEFIALGHSDDHFQVLERWPVYWRQWFPNLKFQTIALRSLETGSLIHRTIADLPRDIPRLCNAHGTLGITHDGTVHHLPPHVNWPLLALCQIILALPPIILWWLIRWREKRLRRTVAG